MFSFTSAAKTALAGVAIAGALALPLLGSSAAFAGDATFPPTAVADYYSTPQDTQLGRDATSGLLLNDSSGGNADLIAESATASPDGTLAFWQDGSFLFTPNQGFVGTAHFTYRVTAGGFASEYTDIWIEVTAVQHKLAGSPDFYSTPIDTVLGVSGIDRTIENDTDATYVGGIDDVTGEVSMNIYGEFEYTPAPGFVGTKTFSYFLADGTNIDSDWILVTIEVTPVTSSTIPGTPGTGAPGTPSTTDEQLETLAYTGSDDVTAWLVAPAAALLALGAAGVWFARRRRALEH